MKGRLGTAIAGALAAGLLGASAVVPGGAPAAAAPPVARKATIVVAYGAGFGTRPEAKAAFQAAMNVWAQRISSPVPITVDASFGSTPAGQPAWGGPQVITSGQPGSVPGIYPIALASAQLGEDLTSAIGDVRVTMSSSADFWYGAESPPPGQLDFRSAAMRAFAAGIGFYGSMRIEGGAGLYGFGSFGTGPASATIYDQFTRSDGTPLLSLPSPSAQLATALAGPVLTFNGTQATAANGGVPPRLFGPAPWDPNRSYTFLDDDSFPRGSASSLMTASLEPGEAVREPGPVTLGILRDLGWTTHETVSIGAAQVVEGDSGTRAARFTVSLSAPVAAPVSVSYKTAPGTAGAADFVAKTGTATIPAGATSTVVSIALRGDTVDEPNETFGVKLWAPVNAVLGRATGTGVIIDDDVASGRRLAVGNASVAEGTTGTRLLRFTVTLSSVSPTPVTTAWSTSPGTATAPADFAARSGVLTIPAGSTTGLISISVRGDVTPEAAETFTVRLSSPVGAVLAKPNGTGTILPDD